MRSTTIILLLIFSGHAFADGVGEISADPKNATTNQIVKITINSAGETKPCGLEVNFGDGVARQLRGNSFPVIVEYAYKQEGNYAITVSGKGLVRGLKSLFACNGVKSTAIQVRATAPQATQSQHTESMNPPALSSEDPTQENQAPKAAKKEAQSNFPTETVPATNNIHQATNKQNQSNQSALNLGEKIAILQELPLQFYSFTKTFELLKPQYDYNVQFGAPPVSANHIKMIKQEIPELYKTLGQCSKKLGGQDINEFTVEKNFETNKSEALAGARMMLSMIKMTGPTVRAPTTQKHLNAAPQHEQSVRMALNNIYNILKIKTEKDWCQWYKTAE